MLRTIAAVLLVMWLLGMVSLGGALSSFIHIVLVLAIVFFIIDLLSGARPTRV
jgi:hypothetical protein